MRLVWCVSLLLAMWANVAVAGNVLYAVTAPANGQSSHLLVVSNYATAPVAFDLGATGVNLLDVAVDPTSCRIYGVGGNTPFGFWELNPNSTARYIGGLSGFAPPNALEFDRTGQAYAW